MSNKYHEFFVESPEGIAYIRVLKRLIGQQHERAEKSPELAETSPSGPRAYERQWIRL
jgi:hypothetical protein